MNNRFFSKAKSVKGEWVEGYLCKRSYGYCIEVETEKGFIPIAIDVSTLCQLVYKDEQVILWEGDWWLGEDCQCVIQYDNDACCWKVGYYYINENDFSICYEDEELYNFNIGDTCASIQGNIHD